MRSYPMPMPFGWFHVAWSDELPAKSPSPLFYFDPHLVAWRGEDGTPHVWDAVGPHLGAHLGGNATIEGDSIRCPMHSWQYDASGACVDVRTRTASISRRRSGRIQSWSATGRCSPGNTQTGPNHPGKCRS